LYRILGEAVPGFFWLIDRGGQLVYANQNWHEYTGSPADLNQAVWEAYCHPVEASRVHSAWRDAVGALEPFEMELRYRRRDGEYRWVLARVIPIREPGGKPEGWIGTAVDIHELKNTQDALRLSEQELTDFFENAAIPLHWVGPDGTILRANQAELDLLGYQRGEYVGRNIAEFHADRESIDEILCRLTAGQVLHDCPARLICKDGSIKDVLIDSSVYFKDGDFVHTRCFTRDVTFHRSSEYATQRLAAIINSSVDAIVGKTVDGIVTSWNTAAERMFGYTEAEMVGSSIFKLIPEDLHESEHALLERIRAGKAVELTEVRRIRKDGQQLHVSVTVSPVRDRHGRVVGAASIKRDVTEQRRAQEALAQSQERLQLALTAARMGTWRWEPASDRLSWDEGMNQLFGLGPEQQVVRFSDFHTRLHEEDRPPLEEALQRALAGDDELNSIYRIQHPNNQQRWIVSQGRVVRGPAGDVLYVTGVCMDVTERKLLEERLRQVQRMDSIGQLAGGIAHEANNMMSVVLGCADYILQRTDLDEAVRQDVDQIWRAAKRTAGITQQLLAFSRRQLLQPQVLDLNTTIRDLEPIITRALGESRGLRTHLSPNLGSVRADPGQLEQVLLNLTLNARDAMADGGRLTIETMNVILDESYVGAKPVETLVPGEYVALVVTDTGQGMDRATLARIFEPFFTTKTVGEGTGLGLSTVYGIVKQSGGFIWGYSEPGLGTTFKLYFPVVEAVREPPAAEPPTPPGRSTEVVVVVEDEPMVRQIMTRTLRDAGYAVLEASNGIEALAVLESEGGRVNLLIVDLVMPEMGGRELAGRVAERWSNIPQLFISGYTGMDVIQRGLLEEGREFLQKPLAPDELARRVRELIEPQVDSG
jgi:PAS domain S-box-containing protein